MPIAGKSNILKNMEFLITRTAAGLSRYPLHRHDMFEIVCYLASDGIMRSDAGDAAFCKGTLLIIPPGCTHGSLSEAPFSNICVTTTRLSQIFREGHLAGHDNDAGDAQTLAEMLYRCSLDGEMQKNGVARSLYGAYLQLVMSLVRQREDGMISSLHNDLMNNLWNARFDLSEEIKEIGYTEDYVRRLFRDRYGKTPLQFLLSERIEYAKKLLDIYGRQMSIKEIAEMCGFSDPLYFSRMFKRAEGISPAAFIEKGGK